MNKPTLIKLIFFLLFIVLVAFGTYYHEPWRDEAHAWLLAKNASFDGIFKLSFYPILWHLILTPFAKLGFDYSVVAIIHLMIIISAVGLILKYGKIHLVTKILFIFSYFIAYEFAVISRNYGLTVLILFSIVALYRQRYAKPIGYGILVSLLFLTNIHSLIPATVLTIIYGIQLVKSKKISLAALIALIIMILSGILVVSQLKTSADTYINAADKLQLQKVFIAAKHLFFPSFRLFFPNSNFYNYFTVLTIINICALLILFLIFLFRKNKSIFFFFIISLGWLYYIYIFRYLGSFRHHGLTLIYLMFTLWILSYEIKIPNYARIFFLPLNLMLFISCLFTFKIYLLEYQFSFSGSKEMANYVKEKNLVNHDIVAFIASYAEAVLAYLPHKQFWYPEVEKFGTALDHNKSYVNRSLSITHTQVLEMANKYFPDKANLLFLFSKPLDTISKSELRLLYHSTGRFKDYWSDETESFWLYQPILERKM